MKWLIGALLLGAFVIWLSACRTDLTPDPFPDDPSVPPDCDKIDCE